MKENTKAAEQGLGVGRMAREAHGVPRKQELSASSHALRCMKGVSPAHLKKYCFPSFEMIRFR